MACTRLLVAEIGKRVSDELVLAKFFEIKTSECATDGSGLLNVVNLLASGPAFLAELMARVGLPSRLVTCVYVFICLPEARDTLIDLCEFNARERRILFQKCFHQLLTKLCQHACTCEQLVESDTLKMLFKSIASACEAHNHAWRQTAVDALLTLTKALSARSMSYLHEAQCVAICLPDDICQANLLERARLLVNLLTFLRETSAASQVLLDDLRGAFGYRAIVDVAVRLEKESARDESARAQLRQLFFCLEEFVSAGNVELKMSGGGASGGGGGGGAGSMFQASTFRPPQPNGKGRTVRNISAVQSLFNIFNKAQTNELCHLVLDTMQSIYDKEPCNYFILELHNMLLYSLDESSMRVHLKSTDVQVFL